MLERRQRKPIDVLGERDLLGEDGALGVTKNTWDRRGLAEALLLHEKFERAIGTAPGGNIEHAGLGASGIEDGPDMETRNQAATGDRSR